MGKTRDLFKKIGDIKEIVHARMGTKKDRNCKDLTEADEIKKQWQEYTKLYLKSLNDQDNLYSVITHLQLDILKCEVTLALGSNTINKANGSDGIPAELFQIPKDDALKMLHLICQQIWETQQWPQDWKRSVFTPVPKKSNTKECLNYHTIVFISHANKVLLQILLAAAKSIQSCLTLCDPIDGSPPGSAIPGILHTPVWVAISFSNA